MSELEQKKKTMIRALRCLAIAVEKPVHEDVCQKVRAYTDALEAEIEKPRSPKCTCDKCLGVPEQAKAE